MEPTLPSHSADPVSERTLSVVTDTEVELAVVLTEMGADGAWGALDREAQLSWLEWIEKSGSFRRANMYDLANKILEGHTRPSSLQGPRGSSMDYLTCSAGDRHGAARRRRSRPVSSAAACVLSNLEGCGRVVMV
jgi:hypothetical protein